MSDTGLLALSAVAQLLLVLLGAVVSLSENWARRHKFPLLALFLVLGIVSMSTTLFQASRSAAATTKLDDSLTRINNSAAEIRRVQMLNTELQGRLLASSRTIAELSRQNLATVTGGTSFCYVAFTLFSPTGARAVAIHQGKFPIYDVNARVVDLNKFRARQTAGQRESADEVLAGDAILEIGNLSPQSAKTLSYIKFTDPVRQNFNIFFSAMNGFWAEEIRLRKIGDDWVHAIRVQRMRGKTGKIIFEQVDKRFPKTNGQVDWN